MKVVDITSILESALSVKVQDNLILFNPSIAYYDADHFIITVRVVTRKAIPPAINTPWLGGPNSMLWWQSQQDQTLVFVLKKDISLNDPKKIRYIADIGAVDVRVVPLQSPTGAISDKFLLTGNTLIQSNPALKIRRGDCGNWCSLITMQIMTVDIINDIIAITPQNYLCPDKSEYLEKNWSPWQITTSSDGQPISFISYALDSYHTFFSYALTDDQQSIACLAEYKALNLVNFSEFTDFYSDIAKKTYAPVSLSTPLIPYNFDNEQMVSMIGIGHIKFRYDQLEPTSPMAKFYREVLRSKRKHPMYIYMFFFFEVNTKKTTAQFGSVIRASPFIHLNYYDSSLTFPSGLTRDTVDYTSYVASVGVMDERAVLLYFSKDEIEGSLQNPGQLHLNQGGVFREINK